jgi:hypothetical protein
MNDKDGKPGDLAMPTDEVTTSSEVLAPVERRQGPRRSGQDRRDSIGRNIGAPDRRQNHDRRAARGRRKDDLE